MPQLFGPKFGERVCGRDKQEDRAPRVHAMGLASVCFTRLGNDIRPEAIIYVRFLCHYIEYMWILLRCWLFRWRPVTRYLYDSFRRVRRSTRVTSECPLFRVFWCSLAPSPLRLRREKVHSATVPFICPTTAEGEIGESRNKTNTSNASTSERLFPLCKIRDETDSMAKAKLTKSSSYGVLRQSPPPISKATLWIV